jgi:hypothetical protein
MKELQTDQLFDPYQAAIVGQLLQQQYTTLVQNWEAAGRPNGTRYGTDRQEINELMTVQTKAILSGTGVELLASDVEGINKRNPQGYLEAAIGVAEEAATLGFTLEVDDQTAVEQAQRLIDDYESYTEPVRNGRSAEVPADYSKRRIAKLLLIESSARDLARRSGIENPELDQATVNRVKEVTGVGFADLRHGFRGPVRVVQRVPRKQQESDSEYMGPVGTPVYAEGIGWTAIAGYRYGLPVVRDKNGKLGITRRY